MELNNVSIKAVLIGSAVDVGGSMVTQTIVGAAWGISYALDKGLRTPPSEEELMQALYGSTGFLAAMMVMGLAFTSLGGFVTAWIAKESEMVNALAMGLLIMVIGIVFTILAPDSGPGWYQFLSFLLVVPAALLGGYIRQQTKGVPPGVNPYN